MSRFYITTPIYYVNDAPHIGHAYTTVIADAFARWHRLVGDDTFFLTGTDEHGLKIARAAEQNGITPKEQSDRTSVRFQEAWDLIGATNDDFIRTTEPRHHEAVRALMQRVYDNGWIYSDTYEGLYCVSCEAYYTDDELDDGNCRIHGRPAELMKEDNYFFKLSAFVDQLVEYYENTPDVVRPDGYRNEVLGLLRQDVRDISISRTSIDWGVPVPWDDDHVFYVWYDALINYATAVGYGDDPERFSEWWPATHHLIGKDIIRFHCVFWPAMLLAAGVTDLPKFFVHGWLLIGGEKMSKSKLNSISPKQLIEGDDELGYSAFGVDGFRYHFLRDPAFGPDGDFSYEAMISRYNSDLANQYGNLVQRVITVAAKKCGETSPAPDPKSPLAVEAAAAVGETVAAWERGQPPIALDASWRLIREANEYLAANEPWKMDPGPEVDRVMGDALEAVRIVSILADPAIPNAAQLAWERIGLPGRVDEQRIPVATTWGGYPGGLRLVAGDPLFPRLKS
ncbi:MAG: methionine--tRNA ligase [Acidimicrobiales bacterium]